MFLAVFAAALFVLSAATGGSTADSCTASLPSLFVRGEECPALEGEDLMNRIRQFTLLRDALHCVLLGHTPEYPANSCAELAEQEPDIPSGNYWILNSTQSPVQVFCEMGDVFPSGLNVTGGWVRVGNLNMTEPYQQCPENLQLSYTNPIRLCGRRTDRRSLLFSTIMAHCGMDKIAMDLSVHAVILQTSRGSARSFLSQLLMIWSSVSVGSNL